MIRAASVPRSAVSRDAWAKRKSPVRIAMLLSHLAFARHGAAPHGRLVHHVVVVERGEVCELDHSGGLDDLLAVPVRAELGGEQCEERADPLAARLHEVQRGFRDRVEVALHDVVQDALHLGQAVLDYLSEHGVHQREPRSLMLATGHTSRLRTPS